MSILDRLAAKLIRDENGCWLFQGKRTEDGYGQIKYLGTMIGAHRASWICHFGPIPKELRVLHKCDTRACFNPNHLFLGTQLDNMKDMYNKGRSHDRTGANGSRAMLTEAEAIDVINLLSKNEFTQAQIADKYKVSQTTISAIKLGKTWTSLERPQL